MFVSIFILLFSLGALVYWVRLSILTMLDGQGATLEATRLAETNRLEFPMVRQALAASSRAADYGLLFESLQHDFLALTYLLRFAATVNMGQYSRQELLLVADFHVMRVLCAFGRSFSPRLARYALTEMTAVLEYFAAVMNRRVSRFALDVMSA